MAKQQNTSSANAGSFDHSLNEDIERFHRQPNQWTQARNAVTNTTRGDLGDLSNEASNRLCASAPYTIIGGIHIQADEWAIFSTNDIDSEIGLFKEGDCSYETIVNDPCLAFSTLHLIVGVGRTSYNCGRRVYWDDGINPTRMLDIDRVPWKQDCPPAPADVYSEHPCRICTDTDELDCDKLRLAPIIKDLSFRVAVGNASGQILNGSYYVVGAYLIEGQRVTDYSLPSNVQGLFTHHNMASSLDIFIEEADPEFDEFELVLVQFTNFNTVAKRVGVYSTRQTKITIDHINEAWPAIDPGLLLIQNPIADKSDGVYRNADYLLRVGPTNKLDFNYQPLANQIEAKWVSVEYPADYYRNGGTNTGYMRDEVYSFFIRWVFNTGDKSRSYHIPGRAIEHGFDDVPVSGTDVLYDENGNMIDNPIWWEVYNTGRVDTPFPGTDTILPDGGKILGGGTMGYWESTELYDDDKPEIWNSSAHPTWGNPMPRHDLCGKPIRHHKFPDNAADDVTGQMITNHYDPHGSGKIRIMGVQFSNILPPVDNYGNPLTNVVGYEILRGSREGWKSVLAKGMINNMREYIPIDQSTDRTYLYPNYPYNPTKGKRIRHKHSNDEPLHDHLAIYDHFLSATPTRHDGDFHPNFDAYLQNDTPLGVPSGILNQNGQPYFGNDYNGDNIKRDFYTFHSPETNFRNPFLSAKELKIYGELQGQMRGRFEMPKDHPRHKFITDTTFILSAVLGIGYALIKMEGQRTARFIAPSFDYGGTFTQAGVTEGTTGLFGLSVGAASAQIAAMEAFRSANLAATGGLEYTLGSLIGQIFGQDTAKILQKMQETAADISGSTSGVASESQTEINSTALSALPWGLRMLVGLPSFLAYWGQGIDSVLELIYAFTPYRQYALQQISHCYYDHFEPPKIGNRRRAIEDQTYLMPELQDFYNDYRINNVFRSRTVAMKTVTNLDLPDGEDDTQATFSDVWGRTSSLHWGGFNVDEHTHTPEFLNAEFRRHATSYYTAMKQRLVNQYGQLNTIIQVPVSTSYTDKAQIKSDVCFNGDTYIGRYTEKNTMFFFYDWLKGQPDGTGWDYRLRKMLPHPRFWMDTDPFDIAEFVSSLADVFGDQGSAPAGFDPYMMEDPNGAPCNCMNPNTTAGGGNCFNDDVDDYCEWENNLYQLNLYVSYLEDCACYRDSDCTDDPSDPSTQPWMDDQYADDYLQVGYEDPITNEVGPIGGCDVTYSGGYFYNSQTNGCTTCPGWSNANEYNEGGGGKWGRKIKRIKRKIRKIERKMNRWKNRKYRRYLDEKVNVDHTGWLGQITQNLITPNDKYAFDLRDPGVLKLTRKEAFMYLFVSGVRDFYVESEVNVDYRDWEDAPEERHYDHREFTNLKELFSTDIIKVGNFYKYDYSLSINKLFNNYVSWGMMQDRDYDPNDAEKCYLYRPKRVLYSLPQQLENKKDNWRVFLPFNYKDFTSRTVAIKPIGKNGAIILFESESPLMIPGVDTLQTDMGTKITLGDGGLFSMPQQSLVNVEDPHEYGSCQNRLSVINTPAGLFYMSQNQGKIFTVGESLQEVSAMGLKWWFAKYLPYQLTQHPTAFANRPFELMDNPVAGIGCQAVYDSKNSVVFFCKKDWQIRTDIADTVTYIGGDVFVINMTPKGRGLRVKLGDPRYFRDASWTMSWDPKMGDRGAWVSAHDWHPDLVFPSKNTFFTSKNDSLWVHADRCDSYCNFYGIDYPFEIEHSLITSGEVSTLRNVMFLMEVYTYAENCDDRYHVLDFGFDEAIVYNSEQCSGLLRLNLNPKNNAPLIVQYPQINFNSIDILYSKEEHKYRFNQFWDITADRGEFNPAAQRTIFLTEPNGYVKNLNPANLNYNKNELERKKFRHYKHTVLLRRRVSGNKNMIVSVTLQTNLNSPR